MGREKDSDSIVRAYKYQERTRGGRLDACTPSRVTGTVTRVTSRPLASDVSLLRHS
jgi:hypothetical protein